MREGKVWEHFWAAWPYHSERQEPGAGDVDSGKPDVIVLDKRGVPGLIELKAPDAVELNKNQWIWHEGWWDNNGRSVVLTCMNVKQRIKWLVFVPTFEPRKLVSIPTIHSGRAMDKTAMVSLVAKELRLVI